MSLPPDARPSGESAPKTCRARLLFADDDEQFRTGLALRLRRAGFACDVAANAAEATPLLQSGGYDVVLADIHMPGNTGLEFVSEIPAMASAVPVVLLTGRPSVETAARSVHLRVAAYLTKPPDFDALCRVLEAAAAEHRDLRILQETRSRLQHWDQEIERLLRLLQLTPPSGRESTMRSYLRLTLRHLVVGLVELEQLLLQSGGATGGDDALEKHQLLGALRKTIQVLEKTRGQFKSKDLGDLRKELEELLGSAPGSALKGKSPPETPGRIPDQD
jgi:DNA-binding response OmpR family regulator